MTALRVLLVRLRGMFGRGARDRDLSDEIAVHLDLLTAEHMRQGMSVDRARAAARRDFGGVDAMSERYRDQRGWPWLASIVQDIRFAVRLMRKDLRFTSGAVVTLALAIAMNNMMFTFANAALWFNLPLDRPEQLVVLGTRTPRAVVQAGVSYADLRDWDRSTTAFAGIGAGLNGGALNVTDDTHVPERLRGMYLSANAIGLSGERVLLGRPFSAGDDTPGAPPVALLSERTWRERYAGDPAIIGRTIRVNAVPTTIVGILPHDLKSPFSGTSSIWLSLSIAPGLDSVGRETRNMLVVARLNPGVSIEDAREQLKTVGARLAKEFPTTNADVVPTVTDLKESYVGPPRPLLTLLMAVAVVVLLIACANVAGLWLSRAVDREREISIRSSVGATAARIVRQLIIEGIVLATAAAVIALPLSVCAVKVFSVAFEAKEVGASDTFLPYWIDLSMNWHVFVFLTAVCLGSAVLCSLAPALHLVRTSPERGLREGSHAMRSNATVRWVGVLCVIQLSLALVLMVGAGLMVRSFIATYRDSQVFDTSHLTTMRIALPPSTYATAEQRRTFLATFRGRLALDPTIESATIGSDLPFLPVGGRRQLLLDRSTPRDGVASPTVAYLQVDSGYFSTLGLPIVHGRAFDEQDDRPTANAAIVNELLAAKFFGGSDPVGKQIFVRTAAGRDAAPLTVVGVSPTLPHFLPASDGPSQSRDPVPAIYVPMSAEHDPVREFSVIARPRSGVSALPAVQKALRAVDPDLPVYFVRPMDDVAADMRYVTMVLGEMILMFAGIAWVLASLGLYATTAHSVTTRTQEIGVRMAIGARIPAIVWLFVRRTLVQVVLGIAIGVAGAVATSRALAAFLTETQPHDPVALVASAVVLAVVSILACVVAVMRAAHLDPAATLRYE